MQDAAPAKNLFARYAERMLIENEPGAYISGFSLNALSSAVSLNVDLDTTLTVVAGNLYRLFARNLTRYSHATPDTLWRHFPGDTGTLRITPDGVTADLTLRSHHPVLIDAGYADMNLPIPWWTDGPAVPLPAPLTTRQARKAQAPQITRPLTTSTEFLNWGAPKIEVRRNGGGPARWSPR